MQKKKNKVCEIKVSICVCAYGETSKILEEKKKKKLTRLKDQYIKYKKKSPRHNFYANYKKFQFQGYTLNI